MGRIILGGRARIGGWGEILRIFGGEGQRKRKKEQLQPRLSSLSPSKNHEMWLYRLPSIFIIMPIGSLLVFSVLDHSSKFPGDCLLSIPYEPILLGR